MPFVMDKSKSKKGASVPKEFKTNFSEIYLTYHLFEIRIINKPPRYLEVELNASTTSAWLVSERYNMKSLS